MSQAERNEFEALKQRVDELTLRLVALEKQSASDHASKREPLHLSERKRG